MLLPPRGLTQARNCGILDGGEIPHANATLDRGIPSLVYFAEECGSGSSFELVIALRIVSRAIFMTEKKQCSLIRLKVD